MREFTSNAQIAGIGVCVPDKIVRSEDLSFSNEQEQRTFRQKVGGAEKRVSDGRKTTTDLGCQAALSILTALDWSPSSIDLLISVTQSPDCAVPGNSFRLMQQLGLSPACAVYDLNAGCTGWVQAMVQAASMMTAMGYERSLIVTAETNILSHPDEQNSFRLMGDAAAATALCATDVEHTWYTSQESDGGQSSAISSPGSGGQHYKDNRTGPDDRVSYDHTIEMDSEAVQRFITGRVVPSTENFRAELPMKPDTTYFHQPNKLHVHYLAKKLKIDTGPVTGVIEHFGNVSSASIPMAIHQACAKNDVGKSFTACHAFGVGLSIAHLAFNMSRIVCPPIKEISVDA